MFKITVGPRGILQIDDARLVYKNFAGEASKYNREGDRNFSIVIPDEDIADRLEADGWNIKRRPPRNEDDAPFIHLPVKVKFNDIGPIIRLISGSRKVVLDEETVGCLDRIRMECVDLDIRPYDWEVNGKTGRAAYLHAMKVVQEVDRFDDEYAEEEYPEE